MTKQDIIEGNKLIAQFRGFDKQLTEQIGAPSYDYLWADLMPVVEQIEGMNIGSYYGFSVEIKKRYCLIQCYEQNRQPGTLYQTPYGFKPDSKIHAVWLGVVEFIKQLPWIEKMSK